jgi:HAD superfamily hydrolase (TIGR01662 family)
MKAVFFDCHGTLVSFPRPTSGQYSVPCSFLLAGGAGYALRLLSELDFRLLVLPHHHELAAAESCRTGATRMIERIEHRLTDLLFRERVLLDGFEVCPHTPDAAGAEAAQPCTCRRPQPGLLLWAAQQHGIDLSASWMVGDMLDDVEAGNRAGCRTLLIDNGNETVWRLGPRRVPTQIVPDLYAAAQRILADEIAP